VPIWRIGSQRITLDSTIVDRVRNLVGATCTIFQRIDGDRLLRTATNAKTDEGLRGLGTYLRPDSEVGREVLAGRTFHGRAFAVGKWYTTAYEPLLDASGRVIGALGVGFQGSESPTLRRAIQDIVIGMTGYAYVIDSRGTLIFHPTRAGQNILGETDSAGKPFIRTMLDAAVGLGDGEVGTIRYPWINREIGETRARSKIVKYQYFRDWDWIIAAGSYEEEIFGATYETRRYIYAVAALTLVLVLALTVMLSSILTRPILALTEVTARMARGDLTQTYPVDRNDEIGVLAKSFNRMAEQIRNNTVNLERTVEQRTQELGESRERYRNTSHLLNNILQASTEYAIIATDLAGTILQYNTGAQNLFGWPAEQMVGRQRLATTYPPRKDWKGTFTDWLRTRLDESGVCEYETTRVRRGGEPFPCHTVVTLIKNPDGREIGFLEVSRDMTERRRLERQLREARDYLSSIVESSVDVIVTADPGGKVTFINQAVRDVLGFAPEEMIGTHISRVYERGIDEAWDLMEELSCKGVARNYEMRLFRKDGTTVPILTSAGLLRDEQGRVIGTVGIFTDITARKKLEAELQKTQQSLVQAVKLKAIGDLVAGVAHELNNPLMASEAILQVLLERGDFDEDTARRLALLRRVNERIASIVGHLRDFSRQSDTSLVPLALGVPIEDALLITRQQLLNHQIELTTDLAKDLPPILGDRNQLEQVFLNLIANARDAMDDRGGEKRLAIRAYVDDDGAWPQVVVEVGDTGGGIPASVIDKIFDPFFSTKEVGKGTGLGLSICYGIVQAHAGKITVKSNPGVGTTFRIAIPAQRAA
jgi:PAS domain S-box-containing protein